MPHSDDAFIRSASKRFKAGALTPTALFAEIGARGEPSGRKVPPRRPPVSGGQTGIPGPIEVAPGPGDATTARRARRRRARGAPGSPARGRSPGRVDVKAKQGMFREAIFPRGMTRARVGTEQRMLARKRARGSRGATRASAEATARVQDKEQSRLGRVQSLQTRIGFF